MTFDLKLEQILFSEEVIEIYREMHSAMLSGNTDKLFDMFTKTAVLVHMTGYKQQILEWIEDIETNKMNYFYSKEESITVSKSSNENMKLIGKNNVRANIWGSNWNGGLQLECYFIKVGNLWKINKMIASSY